MRTLSLCTCCRHYPGAASGRRLRSSHPAVSAFPERVVGSACTSSFSRLAQRSLALRPAHSRRHLNVTCYTEGFSHFVTSMTAPVASGWSVSPGGARTHWKAPPFTAHTLCRPSWSMPALARGRRASDSASPSLGPGNGILRNETGGGFEAQNAGERPDSVRRPRCASLTDRNYESFCEAGNHVGLPAQRAGIHQWLGERVNSTQSGWASGHCHWTGRRRTAYNNCSGQFRRSAGDTTVGNGPLGQPQLGRHHRVSY